MKMNTDYPTDDDDVLDITIDEENQDGNDLPTLEDYKTDKEIREGAARPQSRAGLWTFICLVLLLVVVTAIAVPLALRDKAATSANSSGSTTFTGSGGGTIITNPPNVRPTRAPTRPPVSPVPTLPRGEQARNFLTDFNLATEAQLNDPNSPQAKATRWITDLDEYQIEIPGSMPANNGREIWDTRFSERWALAVLYYATNGDNWKFKLNFLDPIDHCEWYDLFLDSSKRVVRYGITECQKLASAYDIDKVTRLQFPIENNLRGSLPSEIKYLTDLKSWITPFNYELTSTLEPFIALRSLQHLELQYCNINGQIPDNIGSMQQLLFVGIGNNALVGPIPDSFFTLTNLVVLGMDDNMLESTIDKFASFTKMQKLYIEDNLIEGQLTEAIIDSWPAMVDLDASGLRLTGPLPANLFTSMQGLEVLDLHANDFIGKIPEIGDYHDTLRFFAVQDNSLVGNIPDSFANATALEHIDITANQMTLPFPPRMKEMTSLVSLHTGINGFTDHPVPDFLASMTNLQEISMKQNSLTGQIPAFLGGLRGLRILDLDFNKLTGAIPPEIGNLNDLYHLFLNRNFLTGAIPASFAGLTDIDIVLLDGNEFSGDTSVLCDIPDVNFEAFSADCDEIACPCCTICCSDSDPNCNNKDWRITLNGIWEYDYQRRSFQYGEEVLPASAKEAYTNGGV